METTADDVFGAYLVYYRDRLLLLLEIHSAVQIDLAETLLSQQRTIGIYCFFASPAESLNLAALRTCIGSLLDQPGIDRILTTVAYPAEEPRVTLLERAGFQLLPKSPDSAAVYCCTTASFSLLKTPAGRLAATGV